jgi:uncharacterized membrane protein
LLIGLAVLCAVVLWLPPLRSSLSLDELGTFWTIKDGFGEAFQRALHFQGQSPFYYLLLSAVTKVAGRSEVALRIVSLAAMAVAAWMTYRIGLRLFGRVAASFGLLAFCALSSTAFYAGDARPYALAVACFTGATLALIRWLGEGRDRDAILYVLLTAATIYAHFIFAAAFIAHVLYAIERRSDISRIGVRKVATVLVAALVCCAPILGQLLSLWRRGEDLSVRFRSIEHPAPYVAMLLLSPFAVFLAGRLIRRGKRSGAETGSVTLTFTWATVPAALFLLVSILTTWNLFWGRYYFFTAPAFALLSGWTLAGVRSRSLRVAAGVAVAIAGMALVATHHGRENWRAGIAAANSLAGPDTPVLVRSGFIEGNLVTWLTEPERRSWLLAPASYYPLRGRVVAVPFDLNFLARRLYMDDVLLRAAAADRVLMISDFGDSLFPFVNRVLHSLGFRARTTMRFGVVSVDEFERVRAVPSG